MISRQHIERASELHRARDTIIAQAKAALDGDNYRLSVTGSRKPSIIPIPFGAEVSIVIKKHTADFRKLVEAEARAEIAAIAEELKAMGAEDVFDYENALQAA